METPPETKWEYLWIKKDAYGLTGSRQGSVTEGFTGELKDLGSSGWELVSALAMDHQGSTDHVIFYFKRRLP